MGAAPAATGVATEKRKQTMKKIILLACSAAMAQSAAAATGYYLVTPYDVEGQTSIDYKYWSTHASGNAATASPEIGVGYGVSSRWYTELSASYFQSPTQGTSFSGLTWQNDFMLTQGEYPVDVGVHTELINNTSGGFSVEAGPMLQTNIGKTQFNVNLFLDRDYRIDRAAPTQMVYQWQIRQHWKPLLNYGVVGFGELGHWDNWDAVNQQGYRVGPALFGSWHFTHTRELKYEAAYVIGQISQRSAKSFTMRLQYAF
jgi:hypothetical protein